jgi:phenylpyruvate tautomerase PptA (4-oxalocrotonate tautomerase family)
MPIVDIELVVRNEETLPEGLASTLADALGEVLGSEPGRLWVRVRTLPENQYAENLGEALRPVFVNLLFAAPPTGDLLCLQVKQVTEVVAGICRCPADQVHVLLEPAAKGRIAFGGELT